MKPPKIWKLPTGKILSYSRCMACNKFTLNNMRFIHEGMYLILCRTDYEDYWYNTDELSPDYKGY